MSRVLQINQEIRLGGDVTQLTGLIGKTPAQLEKAIGFEDGRLRDGWNLLFLSEDVGMNDFRWGHTTASSGARSKDVYEVGGEYYHAEIQDQVRFKIYKEQKFNEKKADKTFNAMMERELRLLRDRASSARIVKVLPNVPHDPSKPWWVQYPDAPRPSAMSQWKLVMPKWFVVAAKVGPGNVYNGGAGGQALVSQRSNSS
jgi:hypothetical protein